MRIDPADRDRLDHRLRLLNKLIAVALEDKPAASNILRDEVRDIRKVITGDGDDAPDVKLGA